MKKKEEELSKKKGNLFGGFIKNKGNFLKEKISKAFHKKSNNVEIKSKEEIKEPKKKKNQIIKHIIFKYQKRKIMLLK